VAYVGEVPQRDTTRRLARTCTAHVVDRDAAAVLENYAGGRGQGRVVGSEGGEEEAEKGIVSREAVGKANLIILRLIIHAIWASLKALKARGAGPGRLRDPRPRRRGDEPPFGTGRGSGV
jgi:hypothetical protein